MFMISMPMDFKIGETANCRINGEPERLTWRDPDTLVIEPGDARKIISANRNGHLIQFVCGDAEELEGLWHDKNATLDKIKAAKANLFGFLQQTYPDIARIEIDYVGRRDEGSVNCVSCWDKDDADSDIQDERLDQLIYELFDVVTPDGFERDDGGDGLITVEVAAKLVEVNHGRNIVHQEEMNYKV